jgi:hypothetical protein
MMAKSSTYIFENKKTFINVSIVYVFLFSLCKYTTLFKPQIASSATIFPIIIYGVVIFMCFNL